MIKTKIAIEYPHWGRDSQSIWAKGDYGKGILRADHFSILGTFGQWKIPASGTTGAPNSITVDNQGWAENTLKFNALEDFFYLLQGFQSPRPIETPNSPILISEHAWKIGGISTPPISQEIFRVIEEPMVWYESPLVIEPESGITCCHRIVSGENNFGNGSIGGAEKWRVIGSVIGTHHQMISTTQNITNLM